MFKRDIVVIGASAGGMEALKILVSQLPSTLPAAVFVVWHIASELPSALPLILDRVSELPVAHAIDGETIEPGRVYVAPPDYHLLVESGFVRLGRGPRENRSRPAIDVLFRSAARSYASRVIGVVLTGSLDDGASGLFAIKERDGLAVVQDPLDALYPAMPIAALKTVSVDHTVPIAQIAALLTELTSIENTTIDLPSVPKLMDVEVGIAEGDNALEMGLTKLADLSPYTCPECHGVLLQLKESNLTRFRCHTGHAYSMGTLLAEVTEAIEETLWDAVRTIESAQMLMVHTIDHLRQTNEPETAALLAQKLEKAKVQVDLVRQAVMLNESLSQDKLRSRLKDQ